MEYQGKAALITGASSGLGQAFARTLTARGMAVLLTALPEEHSNLRELADELAEQHGVRTEVVAIDLAERGAAHRLQAAADSLSFEPDLLVNSAGLGAGGMFPEASLDRHLRMISVNVEALVALTGLYLPRMVARQSGGVINVASTAAFLPIPYFAVYAASKAFVLSFGEALWAENHRQGVRVVTLCPGPLATSFHERAGDTQPSSGLQGLMKRRYIAPQNAVKSGLDALEHDHPRVVLRLPGMRLLYFLVAIVAVLLPRRVLLLGAERVTHWWFRQQ